MIYIYFFLTELNLELTASHIKGREGQRVQLICTVKPAVDLVAEILFVRRSGYASVTCGHISQDISNCYVIVQVSDYHPLCSSEAYNNTASIKTYTLEIHSLNAEDLTEWWCQTTNHRQNYSTLTIGKSGE